MSRIKSIGVYCGASENTPTVFQEAAYDFGTLMAKSDIEIIYGGGKKGLMGITAKACMDNGGKVCGVIPHFLDNHEGGLEDITELHRVDTMHERKQFMFERSDAFAVLPGGFGTLDELCEILTWKQINLHRKYIFILDIHRYWSPIFCDAMENMVKNKFVRKDDRNLFTMLGGVEDLIPFLSTEHPENQKNYVGKWI